MISAGLMRTVDQPYCCSTVDQLAGKNSIDFWPIIDGDVNQGWIKGIGRLTLNHDVFSTQDPSGLLVLSFLNSSWWSSLLYGFIQIFQGVSLTQELHQVRFQEFSIKGNNYALHLNAPIHVKPQGKGGGGLRNLIQKGFPWVGILTLSREFEKSTILEDCQNLEISHLRSCPEVTDFPVFGLFWQ